MGMQVHFSNDDLPDGIKVDVHHDADSDTWTATILFAEGPTVVSMSPPGEDISYWLDVGHGTKGQLLMIQNLIRNRVCFNAS